MFPSTASGEWSLPTVTGTKPPFTYFSVTKVDSRRVVVYGGNTVEGQTSGDTYVLELDKWVRE